MDRIVKVGRSIVERSHPGRTATGPTPESNKLPPGPVAHPNRYPHRIGADPPIPTKAGKFVVSPDCSRLDVSYAYKVNTPPVPMSVANSTVKRKTPS